MLPEAEVDVDVLTNSLNQAHISAPAAAAGIMPASPAPGFSETVSSSSVPVCSLFS